MRWIKQRCVLNKKVLTIAVNSKYSHSSLALRYFRENSGCDIFECSINDNIFDIYSYLYEQDYEFFCFSTYIWNVEFVLKLAPMIKNTKDNVKIILGGPEAGYNYENLLNNYSFIDGIIFGEGEDALLALSNGEDIERIPNLAYRKDDRIFLNDVVKKDLSEMKFPYNKVDLQALKNKIIYFEASRGCLFNCSYCLSSSEGKTRYFDMEYVKNGLKFFMENSVPLVKFVDRTFNENNERACEILEYIILNNKVTKFHFEISPLLITEKFCNLLEKAKEFVQLEIGIQTTNHSTMKAIRRVFETDKITEKISLIPKGVHTHMDLIAGLPEETIETFEKGFNFVYSLKPDMLQLGFLKLLHNTVLKSEAEKYDIKTTDFSPYEVISTNTMPADDIIMLKKTEKAVDRIYNSGAFVNTLQKLKNDNIFNTFVDIGMHLAEKEKAGPISRTELYEIMYTLYGNEIKTELVTDFLLNNPKAPLPDLFKDDKKDMKKLHKELAKREKFKDVKFRVEAACGKYFIAYSDKVECVEDLSYDS